MQKKPYREYHTLELLKSYDLLAKPIDMHLHDYFLAHSALGSKDRAEIAETVYGMIRWMGLIDCLCEKPLSWEARYARFRTLDLEATDQFEGIPHFARVSFPEALYLRLCAAYGEEAAQRLCLDSNTQAPTTVRINPLKTSRDEQLALWQKEHAVFPCERAPYGISFEKRIALFALPEFRRGIFEMQDEGSQLLAELIAAEPGDHVLDYCAGSGGKSLAFAHKLAGKGQIYLHDVRAHALSEAKKRLKRASIQNAQIIGPDEPRLDKLKKKMDWVLADVPCSGTGTLRRNPDMKWKFSEEMLERLIGQQRMIFEKALSFVKPGGRIAYATCSILPEENQKQAYHFIQTYDLELEGDLFQTFPEKGKMDGFFGAVFKKPKRSHIAKKRALHLPSPQEVYIEVTSTTLA